MSERIGILTGGGDCPGLNAVIRAVVKAAAKRGWETIGFLDGYEGLLDLRYHSLDYHEMDGLLHLGGTILGATNKGRFAAKTGHGKVGQIPEEILDRTKHNIVQLGLRARRLAACASPGRRRARRSARRRTLLRKIPLAGRIRFRPRLGGRLRAGRR